MINTLILISNQNITTVKFNCVVTSLSYLHIGLPTSPTIKSHFIHSLTRDGQNPEDVLKCLFIQLNYTVSVSEQVFICLNRGCMDSSHKVRGYGRAVDSVICLQILRIMDGI